MPIDLTGGSDDDFVPAAQTKPEATDAETAEDAAPQLSGPAAAAKLRRRTTISYAHMAAASSGSDEEDEDEESEEQDDGSAGAASPEPTSSVLASEVEAFDQAPALVGQAAAREAISGRPVAMQAGVATEEDEQKQFFEAFAAVESADADAAELSDSRSSAAAAVAAVPATHYRSSQALLPEGWWNLEDKSVGPHHEVPPSALAEINLKYHKERRAEDEVRRLYTTIRAVMTETRDRAKWTALTQKVRVHIDGTTANSRALTMVTDTPTAERSSALALLFEDTPFGPAARTLFVHYMAAVPQSLWFQAVPGTLLLDWARRPESPATITGKRRAIWSLLSTLRNWWQLTPTQRDIGRVAELTIRDNVLGTIGNQVIRELCGRLGVELAWAVSIGQYASALPTMAIVDIVNPDVLAKIQSRQTFREWYADSRLLFSQVAARVAMIRAYGREMRAAFPGTQELDDIQQVSSAFSEILKVLADADLAQNRELNAVVSAGDNIKAAVRSYRQRLNAMAEVVHTAPLEQTVESTIGEAPVAVLDAEREVWEQMARNPLPSDGECVRCAASGREAGPVSEPSAFPPVLCSTQDMASRLALQRLFFENAARGSSWLVQCATETKSMEARERTLSGQRASDAEKSCHNVALSDVGALPYPSPPALTTDEYDELRQRLTTVLIDTCNIGRVDFTRQRVIAADEDDFETTEVKRWYDDDKPHQLKQPEDPHWCIRQVLPPPPALDAACDSLVSAIAKEMECKISDREMEAELIDQAQRILLERGTTTLQERLQKEIPRAVPMFAKRYAEALRRRAADAKAIKTVGAQASLPAQSLMMRLPANAGAEAERGLAEIKSFEAEREKDEGQHPLMGRPQASALAGWSAGRSVAKAQAASVLDGRTWQQTAWWHSALEDFSAVAEDALRASVFGAAADPNHPTSKARAAECDRAAADRNTAGLKQRFADAAGTSMHHHEHNQQECDTSARRPEVQRDCGIPGPGGRPSPSGPGHARLHDRAGLGAERDCRVSDSSVALQAGTRAQSADGCGHAGHDRRGRDDARAVVGRVVASGPHDLGDRGGHIRALAPAVADHGGAADSLEDTGRSSSVVGDRNGHARSGGDETRDRPRRLSDAEDDHVSHDEPSAGHRHPRSVAAAGFAKVGGSVIHSDAFPRADREACAASRWQRCGSQLGKGSTRARCPSFQ